LAGARLPPTAFSHRAENEKALDETLAGESRGIAREGSVPVLKKSRWLPLKCP
jgi:hypothetical protein